MRRKRSQQQVQKLIQLMVKRIVAQFQPDKIILFGSHARGITNPDSDIDLLVVMPAPDSKLKTATAIRSVLRDIPLPKDVIVSDSADFEWRKDIIGTIEWPAYHEGKVLYAKT